LTINNQYYILFIRGHLLPLALLCRLESGDIMKTKGLIIAKYDFVDKKTGKNIKTTKIVTSLGLYGLVTINSTLLNDYELLTEVPVTISIKDNKFVVEKVG